MKTVRPTLDAVRDSSRVLMMNTLDDTQKTAFRALLERNGFEFFDYDEETLKATMEEHAPNNVRQEEGASDD
jgi:hypothetical protein